MLKMVFWMREKERRQAREKIAKQPPPALPAKRVFAILLFKLVRGPALKLIQHHPLTTTTPTCWSWSYFLVYCLELNHIEVWPLQGWCLHDHTGYPETTNADDNNKHSWNQQAGIGCKYLSGNNLPQIKLICGKLFPDRYLLPMTAYWFQ